MQGAEACRAHLLKQELSHNIYYEDKAMIKISQLIKAYETIQKAKIEQEVQEENKKLKKALNEHYTCYNRCYYLKYSPEEKETILNTLKITLNTYPLPTPENQKIKKIINKLEKNSIYWKLENK
ncbi:hypothetical protein [Microvirus mar39]|uniref:Uncharacterized protein n=1 Tax=Microvirus mar39 TaxID=2851173 RepID=A0A8F5MJP8_9VIRU|nr:hypothetical protein [Microvirus mar39]